MVATCSSPLSRNRTFGENLGRGMPLADAAASSSQVTEGVKSAGPVLELAHAHGVEMPITEVVAGVTQGRIEMAEASPPVRLVTWMPVTRCSASMTLRP